MSTDLETLFPEVVVKVNGEDIKISPFKFGKLARIAKLVRPIAQVLLTSGILTIVRDADAASSTIKLDNDFVPKLFTVAADGLEPLFELLALSINKPRTWLDDIPMDEGIALTQAVWERNSDFFVKRVMPMLSGLKASINSGTTGETSSQSSSLPDTAAPT